MCGAFLSQINHNNQSDYADWGNPTALFGFNPGILEDTPDRKDFSEIYRQEGSVSKVGVN
jgi:hypothetical protein